MAEEHEGKESGAATILGKNPKQRKIAAIGVGAALLIGAVILLRKSGGSPAASSTSATTGSGAGTPAYAGDYGSSYDIQSLLSQYASTAQAQQQQGLSQLQGDITQLGSQLAGMDTSQPGAPPTAVMTGPTGDEVVNGRDLGPYMYGQNQLSFIQSNLGQYGYTQGILNDVTNAYNTIAAQLGANAANEAHYSWISPQNVQAIPAGVVNSNQIYTVHLSGAGVGAGGNVVNASGTHEQWPTIWTQAAQPGVTNPSASTV